MTKEDVIGWLEFLSEQEHIKTDGIVPCDIEISLGIAIEALKQPEIIRCKDCKWNSGHCKGMYSMFVTCYKTGSPHMENWFCADGEKKGR